MKFAVIACLCAGAFAWVGCADGSGVPTGPGATTAVSSLAAPSPGTVLPAVAPSLSAVPRSGDLHVTKECSGFKGDDGSFCTIKSSNVKAIEVDSTILYLQPTQVPTPEGSDVVLDVPGPGNNKAFGHCSLFVGVCSFSGGTGKFTSFRARVNVSFNPEQGLFYWDGTYSFSPED